ncbi:hypothetical protein [Stappia indica]|uniref:Transposase n=1 Tax=Stappia indica TaxID=538381 RepID=A0A857C8F7_9HYPH|nr:hypothetical protein [Stappia indica]QGZ34792.1 hypothetical protein GH266_09835 [Stappia indica]
MNWFEIIDETQNIRDALLVTDNTNAYQGRRMKGRMPRRCFIAGLPGRLSPPRRKPKGTG